MMYPLVRDLAAEKIPVAVTCRVLDFSKQAYYAWVADPVTQRDWDNAHLINAALGIHAEDPEFGYRLIADELNHTVGLAAGRNRVARLCASQGIRSVIHRRKHPVRRPGPPVHDDLVNRDFTAPAPNVLWLTDITEHHTEEGKLYLCSIKDVWSNRIVGYSIGPRMTASLAVAALRNATALRKPHNTIVHSDRGGQFKSHAFTTELTKHGLHGSMGRVGTCADNAAKESFYALLQKNVLNRKQWETRDELRLAIVTWIERTYHRRRRQQRLGRLTPVEFEILNKTTHTG
jgi:transposase InsO family protein